MRFPGDGYFHRAMGRFRARAAQQPGRRARDLDPAAVQPGPVAPTSAGKRHKDEGRAEGPESPPGQHRRAATAPGQQPAGGVSKRVPGVPGEPGGPGMHRGSSLKTKKERKKTLGVKFVVFSDDVEWCRAHPAFSAGDVHLVTEDHSAVSVG